MREFCLTEEVIQRFVDGELSNEQSEQAASHLASCETCATLLDEVEQENALMSQAFATELSLPVPSAALRERLDKSIAALEPQRSVSTERSGSGLRAWFGTLLASFSFRPQQALGFASIALVVALVAIFAVIQLRQARDERPLQAGGKAPATATPAPVSIVEPPIANVAATPEIKTENERGNGRSADRRRIEQAGNNFRKSEQPKKVETPAPAPAPAPTQLLPGELGYLEAIASLTTAIEANKNDVLKPAVRADYERNLAVVDQAIASTRQQAKRNPNNRDAVEFMYMAYQNKIDMLNAVAVQTRVAAR